MKRRLFFSFNKKIKSNKKMKIFISKFILYNSFIVFIYIKIRNLKKKLFKIWLIKLLIL